MDWYWSIVELEKTLGSRDAANIAALYIVECRDKHKMDILLQTAIDNKYVLHPLILGNEDFDWKRLFAVLCRRGGLELTTKYLSLSHSPRVLAHVMGCALSLRRRDILTWIKGKYNSSIPSLTWEVPDLGKVFTSGDVEFIKWLFQALPPVLSRSVVLHLFEIACSSGQLDAAKWLRATFQIVVGDIFQTETLTQTCIKGHIHVMEWLLGNCKCRERMQFWRRETCLRVACENGHFQLVQWLYSRMAVSLSLNLFIASCSSGCLALVKWMYPEIKDQVHTGLDDVIAYCHVNVLKWILEVGGRDAKSVEASRMHMLLYKSCERNSAEEVESLIDIFGVHGFTSMARFDEIVSLVLCMCKLEFTRWFLARFDYLGYIANDLVLGALSTVCHEENMAKVKWMVDQFQLTKSDILDDVSLFFQVEHLHVVKWLVRRFNITKEDEMGCRVSPIITACVSENLHVARWLVEHLGLSRQEIAEKIRRRKEFYRWSRIDLGVEWLKKEFFL